MATEELHQLKHMTEAIQQADELLMRIHQLVDQQIREKEQCPFCHLSKETLPSGHTMFGHEVGCPGYRALEWHRRFIQLPAIEAQYGAESAKSIEETWNMDINKLLGREQRHQAEPHDGEEG